jgi:hypothetical protein
VLLRDLVLSILDKPVGRSVPIGVFKLALETAQRAFLAEQRVCAIVPGWDLDFPRETGADRAKCD